MRPPRHPSALARRPTEGEPAPTLTADDVKRNARELSRTYLANVRDAKATVLRKRPTIALRWRVQNGSL